MSENVNHDLAMRPRLAGAPLRFHAEGSETGGCGICWRSLRVWIEDATDLVRGFELEVLDARSETHRLALDGVPAALNGEGLADADLPARVAVPVAAARAVITWSSGARLELPVEIGCPLAPRPA